MNVPTPIDGNIRKKEHKKIKIKTRNAMDSGKNWKRLGRGSNSQTGRVGRSLSSISVQNSTVLETAKLLHRWARW